MSLSLGTLSAALEVKDAFSDAMEKFESKSTGVLEKLSALEAGVGALVGFAAFSELEQGFRDVADAITAPIEKMISFGAEIQNTANRTSMSTDELQVLKVAAEETGAGFDAVTAATARFQMKLGTGSQATMEAVSKLGLSLKTLRDEDPGKALVDTLQALDRIPNATERAALGTAMLGRGFMALLPLGASIDEIREKMERFGLIMDSQVIASSKAAAAELGFLETVIQGTERNLGAAVTTSAAFHNAIKLLTDIAGTFSKWVQQNQAELRSWVDTGIAFAARALGALVAVIGFVLAVGHTLYDAWLTVGEGFKAISIDVQLSIDLFKALIDHSPTEATAAWNKAVKAADDSVKAYNKTLSESDKHFKTADTGLANTMNKLFDFANQVDKTNGKIDESGKKLRANSPFDGETKGLKASQDAMDAFDAKLDKMNSKYEIAATATSEYAKKQMEVTQQGHELQDEIEKLAEKFPQLATQLRATSAQVIDLTQQWHEEVKATEFIKEQEAATLKLSTATDAYDKALFALNPSTALQNKMAADQLRLKDEEIDKWLKANPLMGEAAAQMHKLAHETADLVAQKTGIDEFVKSLDSIGSVLDSLGAKSLGGIFKQGGGLFKALTGEGGISGMLADVKDAFSGEGVLGIAKSFIGNFASVLPAAGAAIGFAKSVVGFLGGIFGSEPEYQKIGDELGKSLGVKFTDATTKAIESTEQKDHVGRAIAEFLNLDKVEAEVGSFTANVQTMVGGLMSGIANKTVPTKEGMAELDKVFVEAQKDGTEAGRAFDAMSIAMVTQAQKLGELTPAMQKYLDAAKQLEAAGAAQIGVGMQDMTGTNGAALVGGQWGTDAATFFVAGFQQEIATKGLVGALDAEKKSLDTMWKEFSDTGNTAAEAILGPFEAMNAAIEGADKSLKGMITTTEGEDKVFRGLGQTGMMTTDTFSAMERSIGATNAALVKGGVAGPQALMAIHSELQDVIDASRTFGIPIDANTQKLIDQSKAAGLAFKEDPILKLVDALDRLIQKLGGAADASKGLGDSLQNLPSQIPSYDGNQFGPPQVPTGGYGPNNHPTGPPADIPKFKTGTGGFIDFGNETLVALHGVEAVVPQGTSFSGNVLAGGGGSGSNSTSMLVDEIRALRNDMASRLPASLSRAVRDSFARTGALKK